MLREILENILRGILKQMPGKNSRENPGSNPPRIHGRFTGKLIRRYSGLARRNFLKKINREEMPLTFKEQLL